VLDDLLLARLVDPLDHEPLLYLASRDVLYNPRRRRSFPVNEGIAGLLESEASDVPEDLGNEYEADPEGRWSGSAN
jgi:uncharacterized protein YbaR (Trm112 family)